MKQVYVGDYQKYKQIPSGSTLVERNKQMADLIGLDTATLSSIEVDKKVKEWIQQIVVSKNIPKHLKLGGKWYKVDRDLYTLAFMQWVFFDDTLKGHVGADIHEVMDSIIATFLRECRVYKYLPRTFDVNHVEGIAKLVREELTIDKGLELINFFFHYIMTSTRNTLIGCLEELEQTAQ